MTEPIDPRLADTRAALESAAARGAQLDGIALARDPARREALTLEAAGLVIDFSKQRIDEAGIAALEAYSEAVELERWRRAMFDGESINFTERRPALHTALRRDPARPLIVDGQDVMIDVADTLARLRDFTDRVRDGRWRGASGRPITDVVSIGIGGSALGPVLACEALREYAHPRLRIHFLSNIDPDVWARLATQLNPASTLAVVASKSFKTIETARNAEAVRAWLLGSVPEDKLHRHLVAVTSNVAGAEAFGLAREAIFPFRDWVGGRFSMWSAIGLPLMLQVGADRFGEMLAGARAMDEHFASAPARANAPLVMAWISLWNTLALRVNSEPVIPYSEALRRLPAYLQQLQMESNGKSIDRDGRPVAWPSAPVTWGEPGTDAQHSFFQALHQGTAAHPVDFVLVIPRGVDPQHRDYTLMANGLAQGEALLRGKAADTGGDDAARALAAHRGYPGKRPSTTILIDSLTPARLGALIALYEHKTAALGWLWRINSFDQWGVELGKVVATGIESLLDDPKAALPDDMDASTAALTRWVRSGLHVRG